MKANSPSSEKFVSESFESSFMQVPLEIQVQQCDRYELVSLFKRWLPQYQPILEAGCGSGRWVAWFLKQGWTAAGLDWSEALCARARAAIPNGRFEAGDMRSMPFEDNEFGSIVSLGAIEHTIEGPYDSLREYARVMRPDGIAIITVPYWSTVRKITRVISLPRYLRRMNFIRKLFGKKALEHGSLKDLKTRTVKGWATDYLFNDGKYEFYQYQFTKRQIREVFISCGWDIVEEFAEHGDEGIFHNFGFLVGKYDKIKGVQFNYFGKLLRRIIDVKLMGLMLCYVLRPPA